MGAAELTTRPHIQHSEPSRATTRASFARRRRAFMRATRVPGSALGSGRRWARDPHPEVEAVLADLNCRYTIRVYHDPTPRLWPWWATMTHGIFIVGEPGAGVWRARTREKLIAKCERWARRNAARLGIADLDIRVEGLSGCGLGVYSLSSPDGCSA